MGPQDRNSKKNTGGYHWELKLKAIDKNGLEITKNEAINQ